MPDILLLLAQIAGILVAARLVGRAVAVSARPDWEMVRLESAPERR